MNVFDLMATLRLDSSDFERGLGMAKKAAGTGMQVVGAAVAAAGTALVAFGKSSIDTGRKFDTSMSQVAATLGYTMDEISDSTTDASKNFSMLREAALKMGSETMYTAQQSADGLNILAMAGYSAGEAVDILPTVLHLAAAGGMELSEAASYVSGSLKGFASEGKDSVYYADMIAKGATLANTSVSQLGAAFSAASATASSYSQSSDSVTLALLRLANQNVTGTAATTALNRAMADLYTPTEGAEKALKKLGVNAYDPTTHKARDFNDVINDLDSALAGYSEEQRNALKATIFTAQGLSAFNKMTASSTEDLEKWKAGIADATGSAAAQYATMTDNLEGDIITLGSAMDGLKIAVSDNLTPAFRDFVQFASNGVSKITQAFNSGGLDGAVDAFGEVLGEGVGMVLKKIPEFVSASVKLAGAFARGILENMPVVIDGFSRTLFAALGHINEEAGSFIAAGAELLANFINGFADALPTWMSRFTVVSMTIMEALVANAPLILSAGANLISSFVQGIIQNFPRVTQSVVEMVKNMGKGIANGAPDFISRGLDMLQEFVSMFAENVGLLVTAGMELVMNLAQGLADSIPVLLQKVPQIVIDIANIINDNAPTILMTGVSIIITLAQGLIQAIPDLIMAIPKIIEAFIAVWTAFNWLNLGKNVVTAIKNGIKDLPGQVMKFFTQAKDKAVSSITSLPAKIKSIFTSVLAAISNPMDMAKITITNTLNTIRTLFADRFDIVKNIVKTALDTIKNAMKFSWSLPALKLPHITISGKFSLTPPSVPKFGISWYRKAMDSAMTLNSAAIFGMAGGNLLGGGEAGPEVISGESHLISLIDNSIENAIGRKLDRIERLVAEYLPEAANVDVYLDEGVLVGRMSRGVNKNMRRSQIMAARGLT